MKQKKLCAIITGNHAVDRLTTTLEHRALDRGLSFSGDHILLFDQPAGVAISGLIADTKHLPLSPVELFRRKEVLPESYMSDTTHVVFENSLRNYARRAYKTKKKTALGPSMFREKNERVMCTCIGVYVSLLEILYSRYDSVIWVVEKTSQRTRISDVLASQIVFPDVKVVWV